MASSEYLSTKAEETGKHPLRAALYTGATYLVTVALLVAPYLIFDNYYVCLGCTLAMGLFVIAFFNYFISVAKDLPFARRFFEMAGLSLAVAAFSFIIGFVLSAFLGVEV
jgi:VIT1/CCC1 family predicted Fe2+/Mn2+ transporter